MRLELPQELSIQGIGVDTAISKIAYQDHLVIMMESIIVARMPAVVTTSTVITAIATITATMIIALVIVAHVVIFQEGSGSHYDAPGCIQLAPGSESFYKGAVCIKDIYEPIASAGLIPAVRADFGI